MVFKAQLHRAGLGDWGKTPGCIEDYAFALELCPRCNPEKSQEGRRRGEVGYRNLSVESSK